MRVRALDAAPHVWRDVVIKNTVSLEIQIVEIITGRQLSLAVSPLLKTIVLEHK